MVSPDALLPAKFKRTIEDEVALGGGQVVEIVPVGVASSHLTLDERPIAVGVE
jgi:hypothetical protein